MHDFTMPQWAIDRVLQRRGKLHVHDDMDPTQGRLSQGGAWRTGCWCPHAKSATHSCASS